LRGVRGAESDALPQWAENHIPAVRQHLKGVFSEDFQTPAGWTAMLDAMPGGSVAMLLKRTGGWWTRKNFQALYGAC
jgi:hypothetical protein